MNLLTGTSGMLPVIIMATTLSGAALAEEFEIIAPNEMAMSVDDGLVSASLSGGGCAAGFESACSETRQRVEYASTSAKGHGDRVVYRWDIMVDEGLVFNAVDKHLYATRLVTGDGKEVIKFYLGGDYGYEVNRKTCFGPEAFGQWHQVELRVMWDSTKRASLKDKTPGEIHILCNGEEIHTVEGRPNIKEGDEVRLALGLEGTVSPAEGDNVAVSFRNIEIGTW